MISLLGYMGSGKTHISKLLSEKLDVDFFETDFLIAQKNKLSIPEIFEKKGELYFRKQEREVLEELLATHHKGVISLGGGTPCYYNNMELINHNSVSIHLRTTIPVLTERLLRQKNKRPLISRLADEEVPEFIAKHLFERNEFYNRARHTVDTTAKTPEAIISEILDLLEY